MQQKKKAVFNWSGGKDSALALQKILGDDSFEVVALLTTANRVTQKSSVHSIPLELIERQAASIGIPLYTVFFAEDLSDYDQKMREAVAHFKAQDVTHFVFGDIFLADIKAYREQKLNPMGIEVVEPLWNKTSEEVMAEFLASGIRSKIIVAQEGQLTADYVGKDLSADLVQTFPEAMDVCGENGEYHTLAYAGGLFRYEILFTISKVERSEYEIGLDNGTKKTYAYWQAIIE
ncbi:MAG TPA: hypothetical protein VKY32_06620 [Flavobacterium sp.]|nr:hypothetical protein [Flavobacterium sp.]